MEFVFRSYTIYTIQCLFLRYERHIHMFDVNHSTRWRLLGGKATFGIFWLLVTPCPDGPPLFTVLLVQATLYTLLTLPNHKGVD